MKITLSKSQWEKIGNESGWMKKEAGPTVLKELPAKVQVAAQGGYMTFQVIVDNDIQMWCDEMPALGETLKVLVQEKYPELMSKAPITFPFPTSTLQQPKAGTPPPKTIPPAA
jgi:hypothetical protein